MSVIGFVLFVLVWVAILLVIRQFCPEPFKMWLLVGVVVVGVVLLVLAFMPGAASLRIGR